jgi:hypothetical protein
MSLLVKRFRFFSSAVAGIAALGLILPSSVLAADAVQPGRPAPATQGAQVSDVSLGEGGVLFGQLVDAQGLPLPQTLVKVRSVTGQVASGYTERDGRFQIHGLSGGLYEATAAQGTSAFRLWTAAASPPGAVKQVLLVAGQQITRGQLVVRGPQGGQYFGGTGALLGGVIILGSLGGIVAGAIITGLQSPSS